MGAEERGTGSRYRQRAVFFPRGLAGRLYWFAILPFHGVVFNGMANRIVAQAEASGVTPPEERRAAARA
jgi:hypothetical protein